MNVFKNFRFSKISIFLVVLTIAYINNNLGFWKDDGRVIVHDVYYYYAYLPVIFIYDDIGLEKLENGAFYGDQYILWPKETPIGKKVILTSCGMSYLYFPFFIVGHWYARIFDYPITGYGLPYRFALMLSSFFYLIIGLVFLRKLLLKYFSELVTGVVLLVIPLATNMLWYTVVESPMSHVYNFALISTFLYFADLWYENSSVSRTLFLGLLSGLIALIRPTNILVLLIFLLWDVKTFKEFGARILYFLNRWKKVLIMIAAFFVVWVPQLIYWKMQSGQFFYFSYPDDQGFFFGNPQIWNILFSWRKGWLIYTPVMIFAIAGIPVLWKNHRKFFFPVLIFLVANVYVLSSWWDWWFGGGFGLRAFIDMYGVMAFPLAAFIGWGLSRKVVLKYILIVIFLLVTARSAFHHIQYYYGAIHWVSMTKEAYFDSFWRIRPSEKFQELIRDPDYDLARKGIYKYADEKEENGE
jgi:hypothetical protein